MRIMQLSFKNRPISPSQHDLNTRTLLCGIADTTGIQLDCLLFTQSLQLGLDQCRY